MRMKILTLLAFWGMLVPMSVRADVDSLYFQFNENGEIIDMGSTGVDGESASETKGDSDRGLDAGQEGGSQAPLLRGAAKSANACTDAGGTGTPEDCTCPDSGVWTTYMDESYCCKEGKVWSTSENEYHNLLVPQCGCFGASVSLYSSFKTGEQGEHVCCSRYTSYVSNTVEGNTSWTTVENAELCGCPTEINGKAVKDKTTSSSSLICCVGSSLLQDADGNLLSSQYETCGCSDSIAQCTTSAMCEAAKTDYGKNWYWCNTDSKCKEGTPNQADCPCEDGQERQADGSCLSISTKEACEEQGNKWCYEYRNCVWDCEDGDTSCVRCVNKTCEYNCSSDDCEECEQATGQCKAASASCCDSASGDVEYQQSPYDGVCHPCPSDGEMRVYGRIQAVCCKGAKLWSFTKNKFVTDSEWKCGCPNVQGASNGVTGQGEVKGKYCCLENYAYDEDTEGYTDRSHPDACGCPDGGEWNATSEVCCKDGKPFIINGKDGYYSDTRDYAKCGCLPEPTEKRYDNGKTGDQKIEVCCGGGQVTVRSKSSSTWVPDNNLCHCDPDSEPKKKYWDKTHKVCVSCLGDTNCGSEHCLLDESDPGNNNRCVACVNNDHCADGEFCLVNSVDVDNLFTCMSCPDKQYYNSKDGLCHECVKDAHCSDKSNKKWCDLLTGTCQPCKLQSSTTTQSYDNGCSSIAPYCVADTVLEDGTPTTSHRCSECLKDSHCATNKVCDVKEGKCQDRCSSDASCNSDEGRKCNTATGVCEQTCGNCDETQQCNSKTGFCEDKCMGATPVWDIYKKQCVHCYDSISEDWTDLGCPDVVDSVYTQVITDPDEYDPYNLVNKGDYRRICLIRRDIPQGQCVECLKSSHCSGNKKCINNHCECADDETYDATLKKCVQCNANYDVSTEGKKTCSLRSKPWCDLSTHTCKACASNSIYSLKTHTCVECTANQCIDEDSSDDSQCVSMNDYIDVESDTNGYCKKKKLSLSYSKTGTYMGSAANGSHTYCSQGQKYDLELSSTTLKLKYDHQVTITTDYADDCTYGSNLTGEITQVDSASCAETCQFYSKKCPESDWKYSQLVWTSDKNRYIRNGAPASCSNSNIKFQATAKVKAGSYTGVHVFFQDLTWGKYGMPEGTATVKFSD